MAGLFRMITPRRVLILGASALLASSVGLGSRLATARDRVEEPAYKVEATYENFEVRVYAPRIVAQTTVKGSSRDASSRGFRVLANYIFGNNRAQTSIAMTAPVEMEPVAAKGGTTIEMTAPVESKAQGDAWVVSFTMPSEWTMETLPAPNDSRVVIRELEPARFAVHRFSGSPPMSKVDARMEALVEQVRAEGLDTTGAKPSYARYDPPWTPWFMRRNEIWIELAPGGDKS